MFEEIAIIGQGCLIPGCHTVEQFMNIIKEGHVTISSPPEGYWRVELDELTGEEKSNLLPLFPFVDKGGYIRDFELLPDEYELDRNVLEQLDVVFKWSLYSAGEALKNSGYLNNRTAMKRTGIVIGNSSNTNSSFTKLSEEIYLKEFLELRNTNIHPYNRFVSGLPARLIKKAFATGGNAFAIDAACASSLYVLKLACDLLQRKETDIMLAGAVCALDSFLTHVNFNALKALSPSGLCRPFNMNSDGIIPSEGSAFVVLKRLKDALRDGNNISGIIRAIGMSNDGRSGGFLAPSIEGQISAMNYAYSMSGIDPKEISYVECHATGTRVGDLREIQSLLKIFPGGRDLPIGSIKANTGHLFAASGMASLIKLLGMFKDEFIPVTPNAYPVLPAIRDSHLRVPEKNEYWNKERKIGAISNFGFGGSNAHLILEEWKKGHSKIHQIEKPPVKTAVTGLCVITHCTESLQEFTDLIYGRINSSNKKIDKVNFTSGEIAFPPGDLKKALGQQLLMLKVAGEVIGQVKNLNKERTGVFIGLQTDPGSIITYLSDKLTYYLKKSNSHKNSSEEKRNKFLPSTDIADVTGNMSHINATRINNQYNLKGCGFSVFCEELSGDCALDIAIKAIKQGDIDSAIVGAVDLSMEPVQKFAAEKSLPENFRLPASAAVAMVLKRLDEAEKDKDTIYALISSCEYVENDADKKNYTPGNNSDDFNLTTILGHSHAASGLLHIAAGIIILNNRSLPFDKKNISLMSKNGKKEIEILNKTFSGGYYKTVMTGESSVRLPERAENNKKFLTFPLYKHIDTSIIEDVKKKILSKRKTGEIKISTGRIMEKAPELAPVNDIFFSGKNIPGQIEILKENKSIQDPEYKILPEIPVNDFKENESVQNRLLNLIIRNHTNMMETQNQFLHNQLKAYNAFMDIESGMKNYLSGINIAQDGYKTIESNIYGESLNNGYKTIEPINLSEKSSSNVLKEKKKDLFESAVFRKPSGPSFSGKDLEILASGKISTVFGKLFEQQDMYELQIRPPAPPFLLCDRIIGIEGEPGSMGCGTIWTETDVKEDSWYLCNRMMPGAIFHESCRGILFLTSWLGLDFLNKGKSVFRLLGAERIFYGNLPEPGETLQFQVCIDDHTVYGNRRLLFYHYDCWINGKVRMSVRNGQGGFFTHEELKNSKGVIWAPETASYTENPGLHIPVNFCKKTHFTREEVKSYFERNGYDCFKEGFEILKTHKRSPVSLVGNSYFIEEITKFDPSGGPEKRGYLCGRSSVNSDWWFFKVHFKNDPCMPGAFMWEGCIQLMSFYLAALGFTGKHDGWRFEPVPGEKTKSMFRSQVTPDSKEISYEIFVDEIIGEPYPAIYAHGLVTVDGLKAFCCERMSLRLIPDAVNMEASSMDDTMKNIITEQHVSSEKNYSLSEGQKGLFCLNKSDPHGLSYNIPMAFKINGSPDIKRLKNTVKMVLEKHKMFLSKFKVENYELCRLIDGEAKINIEEEDMGSSTSEEAIEYLKKYIKKPFDLEKAPPVKSVLCKYSGNKYILLLIFHHIVFDGTCLPVIINEIVELYTGDMKELTDESDNYEDFVTWQKEFLTSKEGERQLSYWKKELSGELSDINLPVKNKITDKKNNSECYIFDLDKEIMIKIKELSVKERVSFFSIILSAFKILLFKYTEQEDLIVGTPFSGRTDRSFEKTIGYFVNLIAIRGSIFEKMSVKDFVIQINKKIFNGLMNGNYPFSRLLSELKIKRKSHRHPVFQILFVFQNWVKYFNKNSDSLKLEVIPGIHPSTDYHINLEIYEEANRGYFTYDANLFDEEMAKQMSKHYNQILSQIILCFHKNIEDMDILSEEEKNKIMASISLIDRIETVKNFLPPGDDTEEKLTKIWEEVLRIKPVGITDDFFKLGGSSILAVKLFTEIHKIFGRELPLSILLQGATVEYVADILREKDHVHQWKSLVAIQNKGNRPPFYCVTPVGGESIFFLDLSRHLGHDQPLYGLQIKMEDFISIEALASHYIKEIQTLQPKGPYYLGGLSSGGTIVFEMAQQLHAAGCKVGALVIFDHGTRVKWTPGFIIKSICYFPYWLSNFLKETHEVKSGRINRGKKRLKIMFLSMFKTCNKPVISKDLVDLEQIFKFYLPEPYKGSIILFRSLKKPLIYANSYDYQMGWGKIATGGVEVKIIPSGDHLGILKEPHVKILAGQLKESLDKAQWTK